LSENRHFGLAISPVDGRYRRIVEELAEFFSEYALMRLRVYIELEYLIHLSEFTKGKVVRRLSDSEKDRIRSIARNFSLKDFDRVKALEAETRHDVKAVEYFLREKLVENMLSDLIPMIHFGLTSEDVNNLAYSIAIRDFTRKLFIPSINRLLKQLSKLAREHKATPMLARTHGQPASPTTLGKELAVFIYRIFRYKEKLETAELPGKLSGSVGNFNSFTAAYPEVNWLEFSKSFIEKLGLKYYPITTQILPHDEISDILCLYRGLCNVLIDLCRDLWLYCSYGYLELQTGRKTVGSSVMPHKVNPIEFENAEGNLQIASELLSFASAKLQISRLQRDLSDSTVKRNYGVIFAHIMIAIYNIIKGLSKIRVNVERMEQDLMENSQVLSEAYQTILRSRGYGEAYEIVAEKVKGRKLSLEEMREIARSLNVDDETRKMLIDLDPRKYVGIADKLVEYVLSIVDIF